MISIGKLLRLLRPQFLRPLFMGVAAGVEHRPVLGSTSWKTIVDVGGNRGQFAFAARVSAPQACVISFEPNPSARRKFERLLGQDSMVRLLPFAADDQATSCADFHVSNHDDSSSLLPITELQAKIFPGTHAVRSITVDAVRLDELLREEAFQKPALLKVDVQGTELRVLRGAVGLLPQFEAVYVECSFIELYEGQDFAGDIVTFLHSQGFVLSGIFNLARSRDCEPIQADLLFRRPN